MTIQDMADVLHARVLVGGERLDTPVYTACCSDLMSDVLAFVDEKTVLITGLTNPHVIRTSEMLDELGMVVLHTKMTAFTACGLLYEAGLRGVPVPAEWHQGGSVS